MASLVCECSKRRGPRAQASYGFTCTGCQLEGVSIVGDQGRICSQCCDREGRCRHCGFPKVKPLTLIEARVLWAIALGKDPWDHCKFRGPKHRASQIITQATERLKKRGLWFFPDDWRGLTRTITPAGVEALGETFRWVMGHPHGQRAYRNAVADGKIFPPRP